MLLDMGDKPMNSALLKLAKNTVLRPVIGKGRDPKAGRQSNMAYRVREHLNEAEMEKLLTVLKRNQHGHRDWLVGLMIHRHGLRVSEACDLRWDDLDLAKRTIIVRLSRGATTARISWSAMSWPVSRSYSANTPSRAPSRLGCL
jgi:integrase